MAWSRLTRFLICLALLTLPGLILSRPGSTLVAQPAPITTHCLYLPMLYHSGGSPALPGTSLVNLCAGDSLVEDPTATSTATSTTTPTIAPTVTPAITHMSGSVYLRPEHNGFIPDYQPQRYVIVLDVSGSMSANFNGECNAGTISTVRQCEVGPAGYPDPDTYPLKTGPDIYWDPVDERRIYVAKEAIKRLVTRLNLPGNDNYNEALPSDELALVWFNHYQRPTMIYSWSNDPNPLKQAVDAAGKLKGDPYRTDGATNSAAGLYRASLLLRAQPPTVDHNGQIYHYESRVILLTDGVANAFLNTADTRLFGGSSTASTFPTGSTCRQLGWRVGYNAPCQTTEIGGSYNDMDRPITQMVKVANDQLKDDPAIAAEIFVIALANITSTGLRDGVASTATNYFPIQSIERQADGTTNLDLVMELISQPSPPAVCQPVINPWTDTVTAEHFPNGVANLAPGAVGKVILTQSSSGAVFSTYILVDQSSHRLSYQFDNLPAGNYQLAAYLFYRGADRMIRLYDRLFSDEQAFSKLIIEVHEANQTRDLSLLLSGSVCAAP